MKIQFTKKAQKQFVKLPEKQRVKARKQFHFLLDNYNHPSLKTRKMSGVGSWEARVDRSYRFTFTVIDDNIFILSIGQHDEGLGKN